MEVELLIRALYQAAGNKMYMRSVEQILREKLKELTPYERQSLKHLSHDLQDVRHQADKKVRMF